MKKIIKVHVVTALDVAAYILTHQPKNKAVEAWKMHKLVYLCQLLAAKDGNILFKEKVYATKNGVMVKELYKQHRGNFYVGSSSVGNLNHFSFNDLEYIDQVISEYNHFTDEDLSKLVFADDYWLKARASSDEPSVEIVF